MLPGNRISTGQRHSIAAGCDLTRITPTALTPGARASLSIVCRAEIKPGIYSAECRWAASALQNYASRYAGVLDWYNWNIKHTELIDPPYGIKENARWKCRQFSRVRVRGSNCVSCRFFSHLMSIIESRKPRCGESEKKRAIKFYKNKNVYIP